MKRLTAILLILLTFFCFSCSGTRTVSRMEFQNLEQRCLTGDHLKPMIVAGVVKIHYDGVVCHARDGENILAVLKEAQAVGITKVEVYMHRNHGGWLDGCFSACAALLWAKQNGMHVTTFGTGVIASAAVPVFCMGDRRVLAPGTNVMIHPLGMSADATPEQKRATRQIQERYATIVSAATRLTFEQVMDILNGYETWYSCQDALQLRFGTEIVDWHD